MTSRTHAGGAFEHLRRLRTRSAANPLRTLAVRRAFAGVVTLWAASVVIFLATAILPGDAVTVILGRNATPALEAQLRQKLHLDESLPHRYETWLGGIATLNLGDSLAGTNANGAVSGHGVSVRSVIDSRIVNSAILAGLAALLLVPLSLVLGVAAGVNRDGVVDRAISLPSLVATSLPEFVTGAILILVFASTFNVLPAISLYLPGQSPLSKPETLILPVATLLAATLAQCIRMVRSGVAETLQAEYIMMARLKGVPEGRVVRRHVLRNALVPSVQVIALNLQWLVGGIVVTEVLFNYPGIGQGLVGAVAARDVPVIQAITLLIAGVYILLNVVADLLVIFLTPKLRAP